MSLRGFFRLVLDESWRPPVGSVDDSLAKTAKDAVHVQGLRSTSGFSSTSMVYQHIEKGYKNYVQSFKKKRRDR